MPNFGGKVLSGYQSNAANSPEYINFIYNYMNKARTRNFANMYKEREGKDHFEKKADLGHRVQQAIRDIEPDYTKFLEAGLSKSELLHHVHQINDHFKLKDIDFTNLDTEKFAVIQNVIESLRKRINAPKQEDEEDKKYKEDKIILGIALERLSAEYEKMKVAKEEEENQQKEIDVFGPMAAREKQIETENQPKKIDYQTPELTKHVNSLIQGQEASREEHEAADKIREPFKGKVVEEYMNPFQQQVIDNLYKDAARQFKKEIVPALDHKYASFGHLVSGPKMREKKAILKSLMKDVGAKAAELRSMNFMHGAKLHTADKSSLLNYLEHKEMGRKGHAERGVNAAAIANQLREKEYNAERENEKIRYSNFLQHHSSQQAKDYLDILKEHAGTTARSASASTPFVQPHREKNIPPANAPAQGAQPPNMPVQLDPMQEAVKSAGGLFRVGGHFKDLMG